MYWTEAGAFPLLEIEFDVGGTRVQLRTTHAPDPSSPERWHARTRHFARLAVACPWTATAVVCGDFNVTPGSAHFARLLRELRVRDSRSGFGWQATWDAGAVPLGIELPLDHVFVGDAWEVLERTTFELPGSDHRGVRAVLSVR